MYTLTHHIDDKKETILFHADPQMKPALESFITEVENETVMQGPKGMTLHPVVKVEDEADIKAVKDIIRRYAVVNTTLMSFLTEPCEYLVLRCS